MNTSRNTSSATDTQVTQQSSPSTSFPPPQPSALFDPSTQGYFPSQPHSVSSSIPAQGSPNANGAPLPSPYDPSVPSWMYGENFLYSHLSGSTAAGVPPLPSFAAPYGNSMLPQGWGVPPPMSGTDAWGWGVGGVNGIGGLRSRETTEDVEEE